MSLIRRTLLLGCLIGAASGVALGQETYPLTPTQAVRMGLERSTSLEATRAEAAEARAALDEARGARLPTIQGLANYTRLSSNIREVGFEFPGLDTVFTILPVELNRYHSEVSIQQPIFTGGRIRNQVRAAESRSEAAEWLARQEEADVAFEIRQAYWQIYQARALLDAAEAAIARVDEHVRIVENRVEEGAALVSEILAARTRRSEVLLERVEAENAVQVARLELSRLIGLPLDTPVEPLRVREEPLLPVDVDSLAALATARPQIRALSDRVESLRYQLRSLRGGWLPEIGVTGRYVYARPNPYFFAEQNEFRGTGELTLALQWTLWEGGRRGSRTGQVQARLQAAEAQLADARELVTVAIVRQSLEVERAAQAVEVAEQHLEEAEETFRVVQNQYAEGVALSSDVLEAEQAYRIAQARRAQSIADVALSRAALLSAAGRVW